MTTKKTLSMKAPMTPEIKLKGNIKYILRSNKPIISEENIEKTSNDIIKFILKLKV